ncbi:MAG: carbon starvation protein A [Elusimicrobia bacterium]|nr:carbon starvation protein A [Elusimicrobiota bacterium]
MIWAALAAIAAYALAFRFYGRWLGRAFALSDTAETPACAVNDGQDYVPTSPPILLGQHFAAIAAVGPIAGPILAGGQYGWAPSLLWIIVGAVFIGGVHDFACLAASVRHGAKSIGEVVRLRLGKTTAALFSLFIWVSLVYVVIVFADLTAAAFVDRPQLGAENFGPGVATSSLLYLALAMLMGWAMTRKGLGLRTASAVFVPAVFLAIWAGQLAPIRMPGDAAAQARYWDLFILAYCFAASLLPMWLLLQPRGYLGGVILYSTFAVGIGGLLLGGTAPQWPAWNPTPEPPPLYPLLFTTIACGACSGFHGLVASGTTSKQLSKETDAVTVGYGGMLLESLVAVVALATLMLRAPGSVEAGLGPDEIYARGLAHFMGLFGIPFAAGVTFGKLAFATFIYDTLDVATRLGRYLVQELTGLTGRTGALLATFATLAVPAAAVFMTFTDSAGKAVPLWKLFWPAFGASNQLLAALSLAGVTVWLKQEGRAWWVTGLPCLFMSAVTVCSLWTIAGRSFAAGRYLDPVGTTAAALLVLGLVVLTQAARALAAPPR